MATIIATMVSDDTFTVVNENGNHTVFSVLATFDLEETGKSYVIYTREETDESGRLKVYGATYIKAGKMIELSELVLDEEWEAINEALDKVGELMRGE